MTADVIAEDGPQTNKLAGPPVVQRFLMNPYHANIGAIASVDPSGLVKVVDLSNPRFALSRRLVGRIDLTEGYYLGLVADEFVLSTKDTRLIRVQVTEVGPQATATLKVAPAAAKKIKSGEQIVLFRPPGSTTAEIKAAPDLAPVDDGRQASVLGKDSVNAAQSLTKSRNNLKQIGIALHNFHDVYGRFPPAVVYGPDGKPWHSWRILILPYLDAGGTTGYNEYKFDEPWDGPNNKKLLQNVPDVYRDPIYGSADNNYTHYAAITGKGTAFPIEGVKMDANNPTSPLANISTGRGASRISRILDGTSNTLLIGSVSPEREIPWTKPEDVSFNDKFPTLGQKGSFATPYKSPKAASGLFLFADGSVRNIRNDIELETLRNLLTIADGNPIGEIPSDNRPRTQRDVKQAQVIEVIITAQGPAARLSVDPLK